MQRHEREKELERIAKTDLTYLDADSKPQQALAIIARLLLVIADVLHEETKIGGAFTKRFP